MSELIMLKRDCTGDGCWTKISVSELYQLGAYVDYYKENNILADCIDRMVTLDYDGKVTQVIALAVE